VMAWWENRTCDGVVGEGLDVGQVVVRTVLLEPLAHVLLRPQNHGLGQAGQRRAGVVHGEGLARTQLKHTHTQMKHTHSKSCSSTFSSCDGPSDFLRKNFD